MHVCEVCGTIYLEAGACCHRPTKLLEDAIGDQDRLFELTGNDRAHNVLMTLKAAAENAAERVNKAADKLEKAIAARDKSLGVLMDYYKLTIEGSGVPSAADVAGVMLERVADKVVDAVNDGALDSEGVTVTAQRVGGRSGTIVTGAGTYTIVDGKPVDADPLFDEARDIVASSGLGSVSMLQRRLKIGYARSGKIMDQLEAAGVVGAAEGSKPRTVLIAPDGGPSAAALMAENRERLEAADLAFKPGDRPVPAIRSFDSTDTSPEDSGDDEIEEID